ncbi:MAG: hypothetical protein JWN70_6342 [Planctomycetaceae bacterium]|nr:hypothetical protein [Planctomycetaceae bacterium]
MLEEKPTPAESSHPAVGYSYPRDLALFVQDRWRGPEPDGGVDLLPDPATLHYFFSACYHASMLREEERPVTFRAILAPPSLFTREQRPPEGLQLLEFSRSLLFHPSELRRLSAAADSQRTLIGVQSAGNEDGGLRIWGLINSGTRWLRDVQGGRRAGPSLPHAPVVHIEAPGSIEVYKGYDLIGKLQAGRLSGLRVDLFESEWLPVEFSEFRTTLMERHEEGRNRASENFAPLEPTLPRRIAERMMKRVISMLRAARHGGTIIFIPLKIATEPNGTDSYIDLKYRFAGGRPQPSFPDLVVEILNRLACVYGASHQSGQKPVGWAEFEATTDDELALLDEALFETAHLIAGLAAVDGAVVLSKDHELMGFGGMISGRLPAIKTVARSLDLEGETFAEEETGNVGARHRSAYRLAGALLGSLAIVISQDGGVRFVCQKDGRVTYWEQD